MSNKNNCTKCGGKGYHSEKPNGLSTLCTCKKGEQLGTEAGIRMLRQGMCGF